MQFSILTWNCLAQKWLEGKLHSDFIHAVGKQYIERNYRINKIVDVIKSYDYDIVCLQEIELEQFKDDFAPLLFQYDFSIQEFKKNNTGIGNVVLFKNKFSVIWKETRSRALLLCLNHIETNTSIYIANVHLQAIYRNEIIRLSQIKKIIRSLEAQEAKNIIICGDYNTVNNYRLPMSDTDIPVLKLLKNPKNKIFPHSLVLKEEENIGKNTNNTYISPTCRGSDRFDHILYSDTLQPIASLHCNLELFSTMQFPSYEWPSDHIVIGSMFRISDLA